MPWDPECKEMLPRKCPEGYQKYLLETFFFQSSVGPDFVVHPQYEDCVLVLC